MSSQFRIKQRTLYCCFYFIIRCLLHMIWINSLSLTLLHIKWSIIKFLEKIRSDATTVVNGILWFKTFYSYNDNESDGWSHSHSGHWLLDRISPEVTKLVVTKIVKKKIPRFYHALFAEQIFFLRRRSHALPLSERRTIEPYQYLSALWFLFW